jgi:hypothetical protein
MKLRAAFSTGLAILSALALANVGLLLLAISTDVLFNCPPQYSVPMFLPLAVGLGALIASMRFKSTSIPARRNRVVSPASAHPSVSGPGEAPSREPAAIRSEVIIRRRPALASGIEERRAYSEAAL